MHQLRQLRRKVISNDSFWLLVMTLIHTRMDCGNFILFGCLFIANVPRSLCSTPLHV
jgi:hypothetical protein